MIQSLHGQIKLLAIDCAWLWDLPIAALKGSHRMAHLLLLDLKKVCGVAAASCPLITGPAGTARILIAQISHATGAAHPTCCAQVWDHCCRALSTADRALLHAVILCMPR